MSFGGGGGGGWGQEGVVMMLGGGGVMSHIDSTHSSFEKCEPIKVIYIS